MSEPKTKQNNQSVTAFINLVADEERRKECKKLLAFLKEATGERPKMWGDSIVGFGSYHYKYKSGREGDWFVAGFSPRKQNLTVYILPELDSHADSLARLGKHKTGKCCLYLKSLDDIDLKVLKKIVRDASKQVKKLYG